MPKDSYRDILYADGPPKRPGMDVWHRAKQFAPFAALRGFENGLRDAETKAEEEAAEELCLPENEERD
ncbi:MAG: hypothetical protein J6Y95_07950 [Lachnospiraceae bacterium]|nr:hypothetical protein [Lachnospiraceae bacterium]